jgi:hypothetical protein
MRPPIDALIIFVLLYFYDLYRGYLFKEKADNKCEVMGMNKQLTVFHETFIEVRDGILWFVAAVLLFPIVFLAAAMRLSFFFK